MGAMPGCTCAGGPPPQGWNAAGGGAGCGMLGAGKDDMRLCGEKLVCRELLLLLLLLLLWCRLGGFKALSISANRSFNPFNLSSVPAGAGAPSWVLLSEFSMVPPPLPTPPPPPPPRCLAAYGPGCPLLFGWFWYDMIPISWLLGTGIWLGNGGWRAINRC